ncbi:MAG TPA: tetratricopeptide repeat protein [Bacteroidetes bacterium]|nr:tetratricopeptide repeat protein [Bacteroidota bacterium]
MKTLILYKLGRLRFDHGKYGEALAAFAAIGQQMSNGYGLRPINYSLSIYWSGRCYEALGNVSLARKRYRKFLTLWKRADPDLPDLREARRRLTRLEKES